MTKRPTANLEAIGEDIRKLFTEKSAARDTALRLSRETIRNCANGIRAVHRGEYDGARELLARARSLLDDINRALSPYPDLHYGGFVDDAQKEYAEGMATLALVTGKPLPTPKSLSVREAAYLNGLGEAVGELRRHLLDSLRQPDSPHSEDPVSGTGQALLTLMDDIYGLLVTIDFPDAITGNLRRTTDVTRGILEKTRGDLTMAITQRRLEHKLDALGRSMPASFAGPKSRARKARA